MELSIQGCIGVFNTAESCRCCSCSIVMSSSYVVSVKSALRDSDAIATVCSECACVGSPNQLLEFVKKVVRYCGARSVG